VSTRPRVHVGVMLDTKGPEIRTGFLESHKTVEYRRGTTVTITTDYEALGNSTL
jgi:pyruvate kinase